jgi:hypothetical protein
LKKRSFYDFSLFIFLWLRLGFEKDLFFILRFMFSCVFAVQKQSVIINSRCYTQDLTQR